MNNFLDLGNGWSQIPPNKDGHYWTLHSKPWDDPMDTHELVEIKDGKKVAELVIVQEPSASGRLTYDLVKVLVPEDDQEIWSDDQSEVKAAWKWAEDGSPWKMPPAPTGQNLDRYPDTCPFCLGRGASYITEGCDIKLFACYSGCLNNKTTTPQIESQ